MIWTVEHFCVFIQQIFIVCLEGCPTRLLVYIGEQIRPASVLMRSSLRGRNGKSKQRHKIKLEPVLSTVKGRNWVT